VANPVISGTAPQWSVTGAGVTTLNVSPFNTGDLMVLAFYANGGAATAVAGGGVSSWACASGYFDTSASAYSGIWWGIVTAPGAATVTVTNPGQGTDFGKLWVREFTATGANWLLASASPPAGSSGAGTGTSGSTITYPSLTAPGGGNALYVGAAWSYFGNITQGSTPGFLWSHPGADGPELVAYNTSVSGSAGPVVTSTSTFTWLAIAAMFTAGGGTVTGPAYASAFSVLGGGTGSWVNPGNALGPPGGPFATWTSP
jgi:hypothetical protein